MKYLNRVLFDTWAGDKLLAAFETVTGLACEFERTDKRPSLVVVEPIRMAVSGMATFSVALMVLAAAVRV